MKCLISFLAAMLLASTAQAASISLVSDQAIYNPLGTVTLTITATANAGEASTQVFGDLLITGPGTLTGGSVTPAALESFGGALPWVLGTNPCSPTVCTVMNQIGGVTPFPVTNTPLVIAIVTYTMGGAGLVHINFDASTFDFFGAPVPAGITLNVPEPATGSMLALGLVGLAAARRVRNW